MDERTLGIFDAFEDEAARQAHLNGSYTCRAGSRRVLKLLAKDPDIRLVDVLAVKGA